MRKYVVIVLALFFAVAMAGVAIAEKEMYSVNGPVLSVDSKAKTLTVKATETTVAPPTRWKGEVTFMTDKMTKISLGKKSGKFKDIKVGDNVEVKFHEKDRKTIADQITIAERAKKK
jgi:cytochrome c oxidase assembly protein Cox11